MATLKKWDAFFNRTDLTTTDTFQVVGLDLSNPVEANQDQRAPITQLLRAGKDLSDVGNLNQTLINLGATTTSTPNALVRRDSGGVFSTTSLFIDGATTPTLNIGATSSFNFALATGSNQIFNGTVNGDACIRQTDTARKLLLGLGTGNAQFEVQNAVIISNIAHRFTTVGASRMPFTDASSNLTGSANYIVNGTGGLTITQTLTATGGAFTPSTSGFNLTGGTPSCNIGTNSNFAQATGPSNFFTGTINGDTCIRNTSTGNFVHIGVGSGGATAQFIISNTQITANVGIVHVAVGANRMPFTNGSSLLTGSANYTVNGTGGLTITQSLTAGSGIFGAGTDASAIVIANSTTQGLLPPRMTTTQKDAIASPASGLIVYDTTLGKLCVRGAAAWEIITSI